VHFKDHNRKIYAANNFQPTNRKKWILQFKTVPFYKSD